MNQDRCPVFVSGKDHILRLNDPIRQSQNDPGPRQIHGGIDQT